MKKLRMLSLCSGIGGADLAAEWTDAIEVVGQVEIDPFCQVVLSKHWPSVLRLSDIKEVQGDEFGAIDIVVGGIPCQPFSSAGKQHGTDDDRYLWPEMFRIVKATKCNWVVIENVDDFTYMALDIVQADLESEGYTVQAFVLPACAIGAPHIRERCFVVAYSNRFGESREACPVPDRQRSTTLSAGLCGREDTAADVADASSQRSSSKWNGRHAGTHYPARACSEDVAGASHRRYGTQSRMGGMFDGISAKLDCIRWPSGPGQEQWEWEPARTVPGKQPYRNHRLKALGNAIVPAQIFPIFQGIVEWMVGGQGV